MRCVGLAVCLLAALVSCRTLVPPEDAAVVLDVHLTLLNPLGDPLSDARVTISDPPGSTLEPSFDWSGRSDAYGRLKLELPRRGPFTIRVEPSDRYYPEFHFWNVMLSDVHALRPLDPIRTGSIVLPEGAPLLLAGSEIQFSRAQPSGTQYFAARLAADGSFAGWLPDDRYIVAATLRTPGGQLSLTYLDSVEVAEAPTILATPLDLVRYDLDLGRGAVSGGTLQINFLPHELERLGLRHGDGWVTVDLGDTTAVLGFRALTECTFNPGSATPFLRQTGMLDLTSGRARADLGAHRLRVTLRSESGNPVVEAGILFDDGSRERSTLTADDGSAVLYVHPADYRIAHRHESFGPWHTLGIVAVTDADVDVGFVADAP